jgi:hypothetical protein
MSDIVLPTGQQIKDFVRCCFNGYFQQVEDYARIRGCFSNCFQQVEDNAKLFYWFLWLSAESCTDCHQQIKYF